MQLGLRGTGQSCEDSKAYPENAIKTNTFCGFEERLKKTSTPQIAFRAANSNVSAPGAWHVNVI